jgi:hypothetical protein
MRMAPVPADPIFKVAPTYGSGGQHADSVVVADVNGDGRLDLVVANSCADSTCTNGSVSVLLGNGDGTFKAAMSYGTGGYAASSVAVADVNGDGKLDLVVTNSCGSDDIVCTNGTVAVLLGNGNGTFRAAANYGSGGQDANSVAVADVNGDGKPDLVVANRCVSVSYDSECTLGTVGVLLGNGDGTFQTAVNYGSGGQNASSVVVADVNGDGKLDLVVANYCDNTFCANGNSVSVLLGNGDGTFQAAISYGSGGAVNMTVAVADVNGDGKPDLLIANQCDNDSDCTNGAISVLLGKGDGTFRGAVNYSVGGLYPSSIAVGDVKGDGKLDLLVANECSRNDSTNGTVAVLLGNGNGTFRAAANYGSGGQDANSVAVADVNGDGKPDLVVANECRSNSSECTSGTVGVLLGNGDGTFQPAVTYVSGGIEAYSVAVGDVNGDGKPDLVVANVSGNSATTGGVSVLLGNGDGTFQAAVTYDSGASNATSVAIAGVNGDGKPDLLVANECSNSECTSGTVGVLLGNGDGTFRPAVNYGSGGQYDLSVAVGDVNGDGKPDLVVSNMCVSSGDCSTGTVGVLLGNGDGTFQTAVTYGSGGQFASPVVLADVNGDGKLDLLVGNEGTVGVLLGNGDGTFQAATATETPEELDSGDGSLAIADFNGDGKLDVVSGAAGVLLLGNGDGTLQSPLALGAAGRGMTVGEFNRDGKPDLADAGVTVLLNIDSDFRYATTTALTSSFNPARLDEPVTFTAHVSPAFKEGALAGDVTFYDSTTALGTVAVRKGRAILSTSSLFLGTQSITASYSGDSIYLPSKSLALTETVVPKATTTTKLVSSVNPSVFGKPITFAVTVLSSAGTPTGEVQFLNGTTVLATLTLKCGSAKYATSNLPPGDNSITTVYEGDSNHSGSTSSPVNQIVLVVATNRLSSSSNPSTYGQTVVFTATVTSSIGVPYDEAVSRSRLKKVVEKATN